MLTRPYIAIDIGSSSIKIVELVGGRQRKLKALGLELIPPGAVVDGEIREPEVVQRIIERLLERLKITPTGRRAAISLSGGAVMLKKINVEITPESDLTETIFHEAEQHFQQDMNEIYFRYQELGPIPDGGGPLPVLLAGAKREAVEQHIALVRSVGMRTGVVDCDALCTANMFEYNHPGVDQLIALVNIGSSVSQVTLIKNGQFLFTRDIIHGGAEYTRQISEALQVDPESAEGMKLSAGQGEMPGSAEISKVITHLNDQMVQEIRSSLDFFFQSGDVPEALTQVNHIYLTGGGSRILGLDAAIAGAFQVHVQIGNPFYRVNVSPRQFEMDYMLRQGHLYGVAMGLALRSAGDDAA